MLFSLLDFALMSFCRGLMNFFIFYLFPPINFSTSSYTFNFFFCDDKEMEKD